MIILTGEQMMKVVLEDLRNHVPKSLQMLAMLNNRLNGHCSLPGMEFVVDDYPSYSVCWSRPVSSPSGKFPWGAFHGVVLFCKDIDKLRAVVRQDDFVDWSLALMFFGVSKWDVCPVLEEEARTRKGAETTVYPDSVGHVFLLHPSFLQKTELPEGYCLGVLSAEHAGQVNEEWKYGNEHTLSLVRFLITTGFPTSAVFSDEGELVAYLLYQTDGCMFNGFVRSNHRRRGLYQVVNFALTEKVVALGQPFAWVYVMAWNQPSQNAYRKLGAKPVDPAQYSVDWIDYAPHKNKL